MSEMQTQDGFRNIVANLNTGRDKASHGTYFFHPPSDNELIAMYRSSAIARQIVDMPADDSVREWREWQAEADQISKIEAEENRLGVQDLLVKAKKSERLLGGAAIYIGTNEKDTSKPLRPETIQKGGIKFLSMLPRTKITAWQMQDDPRLPGYGKPAMYSLASGKTVGVQVHPTRLVVLDGEDVPEDTQVQNLGWGDSALTPCMSSVTNLDATIANIASLVYEAKVDVIKIKEFTQNLRDGGKAYEDLVIKRLTLSNTAKGINGAILLDSEEDYQQKSASFSQLPEILDRFMQLVSAEAKIPMTLLFRMSPGGMNATGDSDIRGYYDIVRAHQTTELTPAMQILDECLVRSALGNRPPEIHYNWRPLWQVTAKEKAEVAKLLGEAMQSVYKLEAIPGDVLTRALTNALTETSVFPGLESEVKEFMDELLAEDDAEGEV